MLDVVGDIYAKGYYGTDTVKIGDFIGDVEFGVAKYSTTVGILGLGFPHSILLDIDYKNLSSHKSFTEQLVDMGEISSNSFLFRFGPNNASEGQLLFGAVDHSLYLGLLNTMKMLDVYTDNSFREIAVRFDGISGKDFIVDIQGSAVIAMSSTYSGLHSDIVRAVGKQLAGTENSSGMYTLDCKLMDMTDLISFYFSGVEIRVPVRDLIKKFYDTCYLTFVPTEGLMDIGQDILKSAYVVVDMDNEEVGLAQAATATKSASVEEIGSLIPLATQAPLYSYTELEDKYNYSYGEWYTSTYKVESAPAYSTNTEGGNADKSDNGVGAMCGPLGIMLALLTLLSFV